MANSAQRVYVRVSKDWHKLTTPEGVFFGYSRAEVEGKATRAALAACRHRRTRGLVEGIAGHHTDTEILNNFERIGRVVSALQSTRLPEYRRKAEEYVRKTIDIFNPHPRLQDKLHDIALTFRWSFIAELEHAKFIEQSDKQRGVYKC